MTIPPPEPLLLRLDPPGDRVDMVLDTDTYNEIDDAIPSGSAPGCTATGFSVILQLNWRKMRYTQTKEP